MSDTLNLANSIWPNGMKVDPNGHAVFYPLGTNKVKVPTSASEWPKGDKLISPFLYQDDKLVGFVDTKALTVSKLTAIYLPYEHIEAEFSAINKGKLQIHAPKATTKKVSWKDSGVEDIPEVQFKYKGCKNVDNVKAVNADYQTTDIVNGTWSEPLWDLEQGGDGEWDGGMFNGCSQLTSFSSDLSSLTNGVSMFYYCTALTSFSSDLSSLTYGGGMFMDCTNLESFSSNLSSLTNGHGMFMACINLESFSFDLPNLTDGSSMFYRCSQLTSFSSDLSSLIYGYDMFCGTNLTTFSSDLSSLTNGEEMFYNCSKLTSFSSDLSSLTNGNSMFNGCSKLTSFSSDLSSLTNGSLMFYGCPLTSFSSNLSSLTYGNNMFYCTNLTSFSSNLSSLTDGSLMFQSCLNLTSFNSNLSNLTNGLYMFWYCPNLTSFSSDLSSLTNGEEMFNYCKLDTASVQHIADTINTYNGTIHIGIGNSEPNEQEIAAFNTMVSKGWTVLVNGSEYTPTSPAAITTLDENGVETVTPIPFWAKPVQTNEEHAKYVDSEGNFFNILGSQFIYGDDISTYGMFTCEADAAANMRLTPYVKPQTEIENQ